MAHITLENPLYTHRRVLTCGGFEILQHVLSCQESWKHSDHRYENHIYSMLHSLGRIIHQQVWAQRYLAGGCQSTYIHNILGCFYSCRKCIGWYSYITSVFLKERFPVSYGFNHRAKHTSQKSKRQRNYSLYLCCFRGWTSNNFKISNEYKSPILNRKDQSALTRVLHMYMWQRKAWKRSKRRKGWGRTITSGGRRCGRRDGEF